MKPADNPAQFDPAVAANVQRFTGFADTYDRYRPQPPAEMLDILTALAGVQRPRLVVDLGCGTGLSTRVWADRAEQVIGIEPSADMRRQAQAATTAGNITYRDGLSHRTGLEDHSADIITCCQSLHWMEPNGTFAEARRVLRAGGVFAACDCDWPPATGRWQADAAWVAATRRIADLTQRHKLQDRSTRWSKEQHLSRMQASGVFRFAREIVLHREEQGSAERLVGLLLSQGSVADLLKHGLTEQEIGLDAFRAIVKRHLGDGEGKWLFGFRVRLGVV
jgi:ubiquinone/menaquinone biosynthesis C-methylase UbiE